MGLNEIVAYIIELIRNSGAWGVVIGVLVESVLAPIPSPIIIMAAGFIMLPAGVSIFEILLPLIFLITLPGAIASTVGSFIGYGIGYFGGKPVIQKMQWLLGVSWKELNEGIKYFQKGIADETLVFFARAIPIIPLSVFSAVAGVMRMKVANFTLFTFLGALVRVFVLGLLGWLLGSAYEVLAAQINIWENVGLFLLVGIVIVVFFLIYKRKQEKKR